MDPITIPTTFTAAWIVVLALVALIVQAIANQPGWTTTAKRWVAIAIAVVLGTLYMVATGAISVVPVETQAALVYWFIVVAGIVATGQAVYAFLKPALDKLETTTSSAAGNTDA